jgi:hypothetical protein
MLRRLSCMWLLLVGGCVPLPALVPPLKVHAGVGAAAGNPLPDDEGRPLADVAPIFTGQVGVTPQTPWPEQHRRPVEVEAGYMFQVFTDELRQNRNRHGGYVGVGLLLGDWWMGQGWRARVTVRGHGALFALQSHPGEAVGGGWAIGFEAARWAGHSDEELGGFGLWGYAAGELGIGGELFGGVYVVDGQEYGTFGVALTGRLPGVLGALIIPLSGQF